MEHNAMRAGSALLIAILAAAGCGIGKSELPVVVTVRPSLLGEGHVLQFHNESGRRLVLEVEVKDAQGGTASHIVSVGPHAVEEFGWLELGKRINAGDEVRVQHRDFRALRIHVPES